MVTAPFLQMGKLLPEHPATSTFDHLRYITYGIFWRIFDKYMHMVWIYCHVNDFNIKFLTGLPDNCLGQHTYIAQQHLAPVFWRKHKMVCSNSRSLILFSSKRYGIIQPIVIDFPFEVASRSTQYH